MAALAEEPFVVHLVSAGPLPPLCQLNRSLVSPYAVAWITDSHGKQSGTPVMWPVRPDTLNPAWNCTRALGRPQATALESAIIHVELWDHDALLSPNLIASAEAPLLSLRGEPYVSVPLQLSANASPSDPAEAGDLPNAVLNFVKRRVYGAFDPSRGDPSSPPAMPTPCSIRVRLASGFPQRKRLFIIRHGESTWNKGQSELDLGAMYSQVDHGLSVEGRRQAEALNAAIDAAKATEVGTAEAVALRELCEAEAVLCSPLTRALQTCVIGLRSLLSSSGKVVKLMPNARERRNHGANDSIGCCLGEEQVRARLLEATTAVSEGSDSAASDWVAGIALDDLEVRSRWWSAFPEGKEEVNERLADFMRQVHYAPETTLVLVGHSHWIRELLRANLHPDFALQSSEFASQLKSHKLSNCGVARLELDFSGEQAKPIVDVRLLAGTKLVK